MYNRARLAVLNQLCALSLQQEISGRSYPGNPGHRFDLEAKPEVGDLVALRGAPMNTPFYLAWIEQVGGEDVQGTLLRSIDDGSLCDWTNVGFMVLDRAWVAANPHWRWSDEEFAFNDRWAQAFAAAGLRASYRRMPVAFDGDGCTLEGKSLGEHEGFFLPYPSWRALDDAALAGLCRGLSPDEPARP